MLLGSRVNSLLDSSLPSFAVCQLSFQVNHLQSSHRSVTRQKAAGLCALQLTLSLVLLQTCAEQCSEVQVAVADAHTICCRK